MKKILLITYNLAVGGAQQHLVLFSNYLIKNDWVVIILNLSNDNSLADRLEKQIKVINAPRKYSLDLTPGRIVKNIISKENINTIFCMGLFSYFFLRLHTFSQKLNVSINFQTTIYRKKYSYYKDLAVRFLIKNDTKLIGASKNQIAYLSKILFIPLSRFQFIYNGVDTTLFDFKKKETYINATIKAELGIPENAFIIVKTARFDIEKNHEMALQVLEIIKKLYFPNVFMLFIGGGNDERMTDLKIKATSLGLDSNAIFVGIKKDVRPYLAISDLFILTSKSVETFSLAALEAMALGLPCVLTDIGGANEMVYNGKNGFVVPPNSSEIFAQKINDVLTRKLSWNNFQISKYVHDNYSINFIYEKLISTVEDKQFNIVKNVHL